MKIFSRISRFFLSQWAIFIFTSSLWTERAAFRTSNMELFVRIVNGCKLFAKKASSYMFDKVLNTHPWLYNTLLKWKNIDIQLMVMQYLLFKLCGPVRDTSFSKVNFICWWLPVIQEILEICLSFCYFVIATAKITMKGSYCRNTYTNTN